MAVPSPADRVLTRDRNEAQQALVATLSDGQQQYLGQAANGTMGAWAKAAAVADDRLVTIIISSCAPDSGLGEIFVVAAALTEEPLALDYAVTNDADVDVNGSVLLDPNSPEGIAEVTVPDLARGSYRVDFFDTGDSEPVLSRPIDVLACVTAELSCQGISFTNPNVNPAIEAYVYDLEDEDDEGQTVTVQPGATVRVPTQLTNLSWVAASPVSGDEGASLVFAGAGEGDVTIDQDCGTHVASTATVGCSPAGAAARIQFHVAHPAEQGIRYQIANDEGDVLAAKEFGAGGKAYDDFSATVPAAGEYRYALYPNDDTAAYERIRFTALTCVTTQVSCRTAGFSNPEGNPAVTVRFGGDPDALDNQLQVAGGGNAQTAWNQSTLVWNAYRTEAGPFIESAGGLSAQRLTVPQCSGVAGGPAVGGGHSGALAATGPTPSGPFNLIAGVVLMLTGGLLLRRGRARRMRRLST